MTAIAFTRAFWAVLWIEVGLLGNYLPAVYSQTDEYFQIDKQAFEMSTESDEPHPGLNVPMPTLGGKQFWTDYRYRAGWRIQQNAFTEHWRLLDPKSVRRAWGNKAACIQALDQYQPTDPNTSNGAPRHIIVLLHGLMRSSSSMKRLAQAITESTSVEPVLFNYASTRAPIETHAAALREFVESLDPAATISFSGHSMGNIVVRHAIGDWQRPDGETKSDPTNVLSRLGSVVMLGPPNQGASIARQLARTGVFGWVTGKGGMELGPNWDRLRQRLATPPCPFGIIAGRLTDIGISNPLVEGEGDLVVSVEETKLEGATDFLELPLLHSFLMDDTRVQQQLILFLEKHSFAQ